MDDDNKPLEDESRQSLETLDAPISTDDLSPGDDSNNELAVPGGGNLATPPTDSTNGAPQDQLPKKSRHFLHGSNMYLIGFIILVLIAVGLAIYAFTVSGSSSNNGSQLPSQNLSPKALSELANSNVTVGGSKQILTVQSDSVFDGQVLVKSGLSVAGSLKIGGDLSLPNIVVAGTSQFGSVQINQNLTVAGDQTVQGKVNIQNSLTVGGSGNFSGALTAPELSVNSLQLNGELTLTHHINAGGGTPGRANGGALGSGGNATVSGSDTAGTVSISTGSGAPAGCFIRVNFAEPFHATPHVVITPVGSSAAGISYYVTRDTKGFSICATTPPPAFANFNFDYIVFD